MSGPRFVNPYQTAPSPTGAPYPGAALYFYETGGSTPANTYADYNLTIPNTNPVIADAAGMYPNIFMDPSIIYKVAEYTNGDPATQALVWTADPYIQAWFSGNQVYWDLPFEILGPTPTSSELLGAFTFVRGCAIAGNFDGVPNGQAAAQGSVQTAPSTANYIITVAKNGTPFGTITIAQTTGDFVFATGSGLAEGFAIGDVLTLTGQATPDATMAGIAVTLTGTVN